MAVKKHGVHFDVTAENTTDRALRAVEDNLGRVNKAGMAVQRVLGTAFIATAAISAGRAFANAAIEAEQASKRLDAVIKATGSSAGMTRRELDEMADAMAESTQFDDEGLRNAMAQMLKFGDIQGDVFRRGIKVSADLAAFMGTDLQTAVQAVGKALASPAEGVGTLERQIGKLDPAVRSHIESLVQQNRLYDAQALVLKVLEGKIGGTAEALNSGLAKATTGVTKAWNEMLKAIGKTAAVQAPAKSSLGFLEQSFKDIKNIIESGDWVEKALAIMAFAGGWRGMKLTPPGVEQAPRQSVQGRIGGTSGGLDPELTGLPMSDADWMSFQNMLRMREEARKKAQQEREKRMSEDERAAQAIVDVEEMAAKDTAEAWGFYFKYLEGKREDVVHDIELQADGTIKATKRVITIQHGMSEEVIKSLVESAEISQQLAENMVYTWDKAGERIEVTREEFDEMAEAAKRADNIGRELGLTFSSAFEDAIVGGKKFSDVLKGLAMDIGRIAVRKTVTEPLADSFSKLFSGFDLGSFFNFGGGGDWGASTFASAGGFLAFAEGGRPPVGRPSLVGERGPELFVPDGAGTILPKGAFGGGPVFNIDMRGASVEAVARLERLVARLHGSIESRSLGAMRDARARGMA
jgi:hypothetical protein